MGGMNYIELGKMAFEMDMQINAAKQKVAEGKILGIQYDRQANNAQVEAQQVAKGQRKRALLLASRAKAVAGASGAGVSDPSVDDLVSRIDAEGDLNALNALWSGDQAAKDLRYQADVSRRTGQAQQIAGTSQALARGFSQAVDFYGNNSGEINSFFRKFGNGGFRPTTTSVGQGTGYTDFAGMPDTGERFV